MYSKAKGVMLLNIHLLEDVQFMNKYMIGGLAEKLKTGF